MWIIKKVPAKFVAWYFKKIFGKKDLAIFERILEISKWDKVSFNEVEKWIFRDDNSFVIDIQDAPSLFNEEWTEIFPDKSASKVEVFLKINNELITKPLTFVYVDGGKYFVPLPKKTIKDDEVEYSWHKNSLESKVFQIIGDVKYSCKNLEEFAKMCNVKVY